MTHDLWELILQQLNNIDFVQCIVLGFGIAEVLLARANNIWLYPAGIISTSFAILSLFEAQLYAECMLYFYYIAMSLYGWWYWKAGRNNDAAVISFATKRDWMVTLIISLGGWLILYYVLVAFTPSTVPLWDAVVSSTAWAGTWLLARRKVENWIVLNISNFIAIPLLFYKNLPLFALLTIFLFIIACVGFFDWKRKFKNENMIKSLGE
jgi:nicotinamide mononucleotide transporter